MAEYKILDKINSPKDLKKVKQDDIPLLAEEIRQFLVEKVTKKGGHLASNLGVVELTIAIHRVFDVPNDHLIFDVGHQSYVHKILTGRKDRFDELREGNGLSGFTKMSESKYDCFGAGHSSTSLSAGLGFAEADKLNGKNNSTVVVLGDGAFTGGMVHEALNNCKKKLKLIIILNENEMSISKNIGRFARVLSRTRMKESYFETKKFTIKALSSLPVVGKPTLNAIKATKKWAKNIVYGSAYFEDMGLYYIGPVDGNDEQQLENALKHAKECSESVIIHVKTVKGKGYRPAEENPGLYHAVSPNGVLGNENSFSNMFGEKLCEMAQNDKDICAVSASMIDGTGLCKFQKKYKNRIFDVGIAEEHAVTFGAGLSAEKMKPYIAIYSTFLQRAYDNIIHDACLQNLPIKLCIDRAGLNYSDGPTHHGIYDVALLNQIPNIEIFAPVSYLSLNKSLEYMNKAEVPTAVRYPKGTENKNIISHFDGKYSFNDYIHIDFDKDEKIDGLILTYGNITNEAIKAEKILENSGKKVGILLAEKIKPIDELLSIVDDIAVKNNIPMIILEEAIKNGGFAMIFATKLHEINNAFSKFDIVAIDNTFADKYDKDIYKSLSLDADSIAEKMNKLF